VELVLAARVGLRLELRPQIIAYAELLQLPAVGVDELVERELGDNPALERVDDGAWRGPAAGVTEWVDGGEMGALRAEARLLVPVADGAIVEYVVGCLDQRGRLTSTTDEIARCLGVSTTRVAGALAAVQKVGPPGIGARDLRECLLLQLEDRKAPVVRAVVDRYLNDLAARRLDRIARALGTSTAEIQKAADFIKERLVPFVALDLGSWPPLTTNARAETLRPDYVFADEFTVQVAEEARHSLAISPSYRAGGADVQEWLARARLFISRLHQRWQTMHAVGEAIVDNQKVFLAGRSGCPAPLTRADVAHTIGVHESTVSRAVSARWAQLPSGRLTPMADFFCTSAEPRDAVRDLIAHEAQPLSDGEIARLLSTTGHPIARRTVAKYRAQLGIAAQSHR
jgi:RNA polymerase sigma-54 factor